MLTLLLLLPLAGALTILLVAKDEKQAFPVTIGTSVGLLVLGLAVAAGFDPEGGGRWSHSEEREWLTTLGARFALGIDGISLLLVLLTVFLAPITAWAARSSISHDRRRFGVWFLVLHAAMLGALMARDLFLFFVFWELMLVPMWLLIGIWGGKNRLYAGLKFFLYTVVGSLPMLVALIWLAFKARSVLGHVSFAPDKLALLGLTATEQFWCFVAFGISFAIKVPLWPFHTWLPDAHTEAPTAGSVILAGVLLKMGGYGFMRFAIPLFPDAARECAPAIQALAVIAILAGSLVAMVQTDVKRLVAYSSVAHMGAVMLGLFALNEEGMSGALFQMLAHGLSTGALFLLVGFLYERRHTREFAAFGGLAKVMPVFAAIFVFVAMSSVALPGLNGFVGEFLILAGTFKVNAVFAALAALGAILGAWYMLGAVKRVFFGELAGEENRGLKDLTNREVLIMAPILVGILWMGIGSRTFLDPAAADIARDVARVLGPGGGR